MEIEDTSHLGPSQPCDPLIAFILKLLQVHTEEDHTEVSSNVHFPKGQTLCVSCKVILPFGLDKVLHLTHLN